VLVHELGHSLVAASRGLRVDNITLFIFGGVSTITQEAATPKDEFLISVAGPLTSLLLAGVFSALGVLLPDGSAEGALVGYVASANLLLGVFNVVPAFPLDGGRVLRSIIWALSSNLLGTTRIASYIGQGVAWLLICLGSRERVRRRFLRRSMDRVHRLVPEQRRGGFATRRHCTEPARQSTCHQRDGLVPSTSVA
jgi:Zn-dependent protease